MRLPINRDLSDDNKNEIASSFAMLNEETNKQITN